MNLTQGLHRAVQQSPHGTMHAGAEAVTFTQVRGRVARLAGALQKQGLASGDRVALLSLNSLAYSEMLLAVPWADGVLLPLNTRWSISEISYALDDSGATILYVDDAFAAMVPDIIAKCPHLKTVIHQASSSVDGTLAYEELIAGSEPVSDARRGGDDLLGLFYTGGTTGFPKGVMLSHRALLTSTLAGAATGNLFGPGCRYLHVAPMFHLADLFAWSAVVMRGGTHYALATFDPGQVLDVIETEQIQGIVLVPTMLQMLVDHQANAQRDLSSVEAILYGAAPISSSLLERALAAFPSAKFTQAYGMTEAAAIATFLAPEDHADETRRRSAGRAASHDEILIVDEQGAEVERGKVGEIAVRSESLMTGYWNKPEETEKVLRDGWYYSGDGGYMDEKGYVFIVDRLKDMIVTGGENVYSIEVENAIASLDDVVMCAVIGVPDDRWGEAVHAVVVLRPGSSLSESEVRDHVKEQIAGYKVPRSVEFVDGLPISPAGKILKRELRSAHWSGDKRNVN